MRLNIVMLVATAVFFIGCQHGTSGSNAPTALDAASPDAAIRTAIRAHLAHNSNLNPNAFETDVKRVTLDGDRAQAEVEFHVKDGPGVMQLTYALTKQNGAWAVVESTPKGSNFSHPQMNQAPTNVPNTDTGGNSSIFRTMDNFHGAAASPAQKLPPGHPPVNGTPTGSSAQTP